MICGMSIVATTGSTSTGSRSRWPRKTWRSRSPSQWGIDISCAAVTPFAAPSAAAAELELLDLRGRRATATPTGRAAPPRPS